MKKSLSKTRKYHYILYIVPILFILTVLKTSALTYQSDTNVDFTINPTISMTVSGDLIIDNLTPGSSSDSNIIEVGVSTNASHGYYLSATVGSSNTDTNLTNSENSNYKFSNLSSNASSLSNFSDNEWGYSYSTDGGTNWISGSQGSTSSGYNGLPLDGNDSGVTGITLVDTTTPLATNQVKFKIGAKASNTQASGTYTNTINFYAITHQAPLTFDDAFAAAGKTKYLGYYTMQDMTHDICVNTEQGLNTKLIDTRDNEIYTIAKLKDDNCWMLDNMRLGSNDNSITLTPLDTNIENDYTLPQGVTSGFNSYTEPRLNAFYKYNEVTHYGIGSGKTGTYYNFCVTSAGTYCYEGGAGADVPGTLIDAPYDICPKNWRIPTGGISGEYQALYEKYSSTQEASDTLSVQYNLSTVMTGYYLHDYIAYNESSENWSSTLGGNSSRMFIFSTSDSIVQLSDIVRFVGIPIRCLARD